jgi:HEAT repeat protein
VALAGFDALSEIGGDHAGRLARSALKRSEPDVIRAAVACLGANGCDEDLTEAIPLVAHHDWSVRAEIAEVLSDRGLRKSLPALLRRLEVEDDAFVRQVILRAIGRLEE